jgi:hypothetical protein
LPIHGKPPPTGRREWAGTAIGASTAGDARAAIGKTGNKSPTAIAWRAPTLIQNGTLAKRAPRNMSCMQMADTGVGLKAAEDKSCMIH